MGRKHHWAPLRNGELGPKAAEHPAGVMWRACSIPSSPALLSLMQRPPSHAPSFDSLFSPALSPSPCPHPHCGLSCLETHHHGSAGLSFGFPISLCSLCSSNTHPGALLPWCSSRFPLLSPYPCSGHQKCCLQPPELQRGRTVCWCERAGIQLQGFAVPSTEKGWLSSSFTPGTALGSSLP